ncbi:MAG: hypothetical protein ACI9U2_004518 [Bradymonadia bacterium]|jgi:hypothetical protein
MLHSHWLLCLCLPLTIAMGCGPDFEDEKRIDGYRVLGVQANPPEVSPDGVVTLITYDYDTEPNRARSYTWDVCLLNPGDIGGFECLDERVNFRLESTGPTASVDFGPDGLGVRALFEALSPVRGVDGREVTLQDGFDVYVHLVSSAEGGREISTYKRISIRDGETLNRNPTVTQIEITGQDEAVVEPGETIELTVITDEETRDVRPDGVTEVYAYRWFVIDGTVEDGFGPTTSSIDYTAPNEPGQDLVFVMVRDGQGGAVLETLSITIAQ